MIYLNLWIHVIYIFDYNNKSSFSFTIMSAAAASASAASAIIRCQDLDVSKIRITDIRKDRNGNLVCYINYDGVRGRFLIETETGHTFGVGNYVDEKKGIVSKYSMTYTERGSTPEASANVSKLFDFLRALDEHMVDFLIKNSEHFYKEKLTNDDRRSVARSYAKYAIVKKNKNLKTGEVYPDSFKIGFQTDRDDKNKPLVSLLVGKSKVDVNSFEELAQYVPKNSSVRLVIEPRIYLLADCAGIKFTARFMKVSDGKKGSPLPTEFTFSDSNDEAEAEAEEEDA